MASFSSALSQHLQPQLSLTLHVPSLAMLQLLQLRVLPLLQLRFIVLQQLLQLRANAEQRFL